MRIEFCNQCDQLKPCWSLRVYGFMCDDCMTKLFNKNKEIMKAKERSDENEQRDNEDIFPG
jgi:hypothetical protein